MRFGEAPIENALCSVISNQERLHISIVTSDGERHTLGKIEPM